MYHQSNHQNDRCMFHRLLNMKLDRLKKDISFSKKKQTKITEKVKKKQTFV